jgi:hypothetical protein
MGLFGVGVVGVSDGVDVGLMTVELIKVQHTPKITDAKPTDNRTAIFFIAPVLRATSASELNSNF